MSGSYGAGANLLDPTIALKAVQPQPVNLLAMASQAQDFQRNQLAVQSAQQELNARNAIGQAYQQSIDPNTGAFNATAFRARVAADPDAAYGAGDAVTQSQSQQTQQLTNEGTTLKNQAQKIGFLAGLAAPLAANPDVTKGDVQNTIQHAVNFGLVDAGTAQQMLNSIPNDPGQVRGTLNQFLKANMAPSEEYAHIYGGGAQVNNGPSIVSGTVAPADQGGGFRPNSVTPLGISPETAAGQDTGVDANGNPTVTTRGARLAGEGAGALLNPGSTRPAAPGSQKYPWNQGGAYSPAVGAPDAGGSDFSGAGAQPTASAPTGTVITGPAPGQVEAQRMQQAAGAEGANSLMQAATGSKDRLGVLGNMAGDLTQFDSGSSLAGSMRGLFANINPVVGTSFDAEGIQAAQSFDKYAQQIAQAQSTAMGHGSDAKLASAQAANPNSHLQNATNQQMIHVLQGNEDAIQAKANAWQSYLLGGGKPGDFQAWNQNFTQTFDPRVYQMLRMTPDERANVQAQMAKSGELPAFRKATNAMAGAGLIPGYSPSGN